MRVTIHIKLWLLLLLLAYAGLFYWLTDWQHAIVAATSASAGGYTTHRWRSSAMFNTYCTYRKCGHSRLGALRIAARHHLGKP